jgi:hypothetical protein
MKTYGGVIVQISALDGSNSTASLSDRFALGERALGIL